MKTIDVVVGGTFTDIIYCDMQTREVAIHRVSATPDNPSRAVVAGVAELMSGERHQDARRRLRLQWRDHGNERGARALRRGRPAG